MNNKLEQRSVEILPKDQLAKELSGKTLESIQILERNAPKLSDVEIQQIADQISQELIERWLETLPPKEKATWKGRLTKLAYDIGIGLTTSGIWAALVYAASIIAMLEGPEKTERQIKNDQRMRMIRAKLAEGLPGEVVEDLDFIIESLESRVAGHDQLVERLLHSEAFQQVLAEVEQEDARIGINCGGFEFKEFSAIELLSAVTTRMRRSVQEQIVPSFD